CQVYHGIGNEHERTSQAVQESRGHIILDDSHIARAVYSASCGGSLGDFHSTWGGAGISYLESHLDNTSGEASEFAAGLDESNIGSFLAAQPDAFCNIDRYNAQSLFRWDVGYSGTELTEHVNARYEVGQVRDLTILNRDDSGRVTLLRIEGEEGTVEVERELAIRRALGGLRSGLFTFEIAHDSSGNVSRIDIRGGGFGHGVGLCQIGAIGAAESGLSFEEILQHYYPGTRIEAMWE
ncbi:MAG: SpoIID/LytB domain-containing protein, partial [Myxococcales bacterium]|nr:SpoIID/LytB domain-containing protein [Myxococcales bacterium]